MTQIDSKLLLSEERELIRQIYLQMAKGEKEQELVRLVEAFELLKKMFSIELAEEDWEKLTFPPTPSLRGVPLGRRSNDGISEMFNLKKTISFISRELKDRAPKFTESDLSKLSQAQSLATYFYELAEKRNEIFAQKIVQAMDRNHENTSVVVVGGFHEKGLQQALNAQGISTTVISPKIQNAFSDIPYFERMMGKMPEFDLVLKHALSASTLEEALLISGIPSDQIKGQALNYLSRLTSSLTTSHTEVRTEMRTNRDAMEGDLLNQTRIFRSDPEWYQQQRVYQDVKDYLIAQGIQWARQFFIVQPEHLPQAAAEQVAGEIESLQKDRSRVVNLVLATGETQAIFLNLLAQRQEVDWTRVRIFHLDEYEGLDESDNRSFAHYLKVNFFERMNENNHVPEANIYLIARYVRGKNLVEIQSALNQYTNDLEKVGGADILLHGLGPDGHLAFNMPGSLFESKMRRVRLSDATIKVNTASRGGAVVIPPFAYTMGLADMFRARRIFSLVTRVERAGILRDALLGPVTTNIPASGLKNLKQVTAFVATGPASAIIHEARAQLQKTKERTELRAENNQEWLPGERERMMRTSGKSDSFRHIISGVKNVRVVEVLRSATESPRSVEGDFRFFWPHAAAATSATQWHATNGNEFVKDRADAALLNAIDDRFKMLNEPPNDEHPILLRILSNEGERDDAARFPTGIYRKVKNDVLPQTQMRQVDWFGDVLEVTNGMVSESFLGPVTTGVFTEEDGALSVPDAAYIYRWQVSKEARDADIQISKNVAQDTDHNVSELARVTGKKVENMKFAILIRERHHSILQKLKNLGIAFDTADVLPNNNLNFKRLETEAKKKGFYQSGNVYLIKDGDSMPVFKLVHGPNEERLDAVIGAGGPNEVLMAAFVAKVFGGKFRGMLVPSSALAEGTKDADIEEAEFSSEERSKLVHHNLIPPNATKDELNQIEEQLKDAHALNKFLGDARDAQRNAARVWTEEDAIPGKDGVFYAANVKREGFPNPWLPSLEGLKFDPKEGTVSVHQVRATLSGDVRVFQIMFETKLKELKNDIRYDFNLIKKKLDLESAEKFDLKQKIAKNYHALGRIFARFQYFAVAHYYFMQAQAYAATSAQYERIQAEKLHFEGMQKLVGAQTMVTSEEDDPNYNALKRFGNSFRTSSHWDSEIIGTGTESMFFLLLKVEALKYEKKIEKDINGKQKPKLSDLMFARHYWIKRTHYVLETREENEEHIKKLNQLIQKYEYSDGDSEALFIDEAMPELLNRSELRSNESPAAPEDFYDAKANEFVAFANETGELPWPTVELTRLFRLGDIKLDITQLTMESKETYWRKAIEFLLELKNRNGKIALAEPIGGKATRMRTGVLPPILVQAIQAQPEDYANPKYLTVEEWTIINQKYNGNWRQFVQTLDPQISMDNNTNKLVAGNEKDHAILKRIVNEAKALLPAGQDKSGNYYSFLAFHLLNVKHANDEMEKMGLGRPFIAEAMANEEYYSQIISHLARHYFYGLKVKALDQDGNPVSLEDTDKIVDINHNDLESELIIFNQPLIPRVVAPATFVPNRWAQDQEIPARIKALQEKADSLPNSDPFKQELLDEIKIVEKERVFKNEKAFQYALKFSREHEGTALHSPGTMTPGGHGWYHVAQLLSGVSSRREPALITNIKRKIEFKLIHNTDNMAEINDAAMIILGYMLDKDLLQVLEASRKPATERGSGGGGFGWIKEKEKEMPAQLEYSVIRASLGFDPRTKKSISPEFNPADEVKKNQTEDKVPVNNASLWIRGTTIDENFNLSKDDVYSRLIGHEQLEAAVKEALLHDNYEPLSNLAGLAQEKLGINLTLKPIKDPTNLNPGEDDIILSVVLEIMAWDVQKGDGVRDRMDVVLVPSIKDSARNGYDPAQVRFNPLKDLEAYSDPEGMRSRAATLQEVVDGSGLFEARFKKIASEIINRSEARNENSKLRNEAMPSSSVGNAANLAAEPRIFRSTQKVDLGSVVVETGKVNTQPASSITVFGENGNDLPRILNPKTLLPIVPTGIQNQNLDVMLTFDDETEIALLVEDSNSAESLKTFDALFALTQVGGSRRVVVNVPEIFVSTLNQALDNYRVHSKLRLAKGTAVRAQSFGNEASLVRSLSSVRSGKTLWVTSFELAERVASQLNNSAEIVASDYVMNGHRRTSYQTTLFEQIQLTAAYLLLPKGFQLDGFHQNIFVAELSTLNHVVASFEQILLAVHELLTSA